MKCLSRLGQFIILYQKQNVTNSSRRRETKRTKAKSSYLESSTRGETRAPRGMFPWSVFFPLFRVPEKRSNCRLTLRPKCRSGAKKDSTRIEREGKKRGNSMKRDEGRAGHRERNWVSSYISGHISGRLFTRQWFQPRPDKIIQMIRPTVNSIWESLWLFANPFTTVLACLDASTRSLIPFV